MTERLSSVVDETLRIIEVTHSPGQIQPNIDELVQLTQAVLLENPFERSGQTQNLEVIRAVIAQETGVSSDYFGRQGGIQQTVATFWKTDEIELNNRLEIFETRIKPLLDVNYFRKFDLSGHLVDHFWRIDLPFLLLFWIEFIARWLMAVRRRSFAKWFFFPIFHWYDVLGLIPNHYFRPFRLLRAVSMYMRLRSSELSRVGKDVFSRGVAYISNIITEEISDMVFLRILNEYQEEIRDGTHLRIIERTFGSRRREIENVLTNQVHDLLTDESTLLSLREVLNLNLENAVESAQMSVPLPSPLVKPVVRAVGQVVLDSILDSISTTLASDEGRKRVETLVSTILYNITAGEGLKEVESLTHEISVDVIEHMKDTVKVRKWAQPEKDRMIEE